jgi:proteasome lid subunit RPN8/RPN11
MQRQLTLSESVRQEKRKELQEQKRPIPGFDPCENCEYLSYCEATPEVKDTCLIGINCDDKNPENPGVREEKRIKVPLMAERVKIRSSKDVINNLREEYMNEKRECFGVLYLSTKNEVIDDEVIAIGSLNACVVHPREVFKRAIVLSACAVIVVHNHPSGDPHPSKDDIEITLDLSKAGKILGIELLDSIIVGKDSFISLREKGFF